MTDRRQGLTDADFAALKVKRDEAISAIVKASATSMGWDGKEPLHYHASPPQDGCYCACPDGPCQHEFEGWREFDDGRGGETVCKHCGLGAMSHDLRFMP